MHITPCRAALCAVIAIAPGCVDRGDDLDATADSTVSERASPLLAQGKRLFEEPLPHSNGRSCATCHVMDEHTALSPENVEARLAADPSDPLFHRLDADDPTAATLTFDHLRMGLVRVTLPLPANMDLIDLQGNVVTPPHRTISVWRSVPSIQNTAVTGPYQLDGRAANLSVQAQDAITVHSEGPVLPGHKLDQIAAFESAQFSSARAAFVATLIRLGVAPEDVPIPEQTMALNEQERRGRDVYNLACGTCHGGATTNQIVDRAIHDALFHELQPNGNMVFDVLPDQGPVARTVPHEGEALNTGVGILSGYGQMGLIPSGNDSIELPRYRFRFYTDGTRRQQVTDLPPVPVTASGDPNDLTPALDERGAPIVGPSQGVQWFSTDPGRAAITGDPLDFEAFDVPQLRGIAHTAPYFHDNNSRTLRDVVDLYSRFILVGLGLPEHPPEQPGGQPEMLSVQQKQDLLAFLNRL
ncbi:MAG: cytochrome-c peroxidase [Kofleriaceae bacterium]|nr:cytochrome-c peroxidase [Kofleriaceae bacterium]